MFTIVAFSESQDSAGVLVKVAGVEDAHVRVNGDNIVVPDQLTFLSAILALGEDITQAQMESPSLRRMFLLDLALLAESLLPGDKPQFNDRFDSPLKLDAGEHIRFLASEDDAAAEDETGIVFLSDGPQAPISGDISTVRATATNATGAFVWKNASISFSQTLPAGRYALVGCRAQSTVLIATRFVFVGGTWRPGVIGVNAVGEEELKIFRNGALGVYGEFEHDQPPTIDSIGTALNDTITLHLDLIKVA